MNNFILKFIKIIYYIKKEKSGKEIADPLFVHFSFEDYKACYYGKN